MNPTANRTVDLHFAAQLDRMERSKPEVDSVYVESVPPASFVTLVVSQEALEWVQTIAFPKGSGNQAPHVFSSNGMTREVQRESRARKEILALENIFSGRSDNENLCSIVDWVTQCGIGNCADNAQAAAVKLASLLNDLPPGA